jgi:ribosome-binding factor A
MAVKRTDRLNSLLKQVISDVIHKEVKNPHLPPLLTITGVEITSDLQHAKVYVSVIGSPTIKAQAIATLQQASGFISTRASKQVVLRFFPHLTFLIDETVEKQGHMEDLIQEIQKERSAREHNDE